MHVREDFLSWINRSLPSNETPAWLGLPDNAEIMLLTNQGTAILALLNGPVRHLSYVLPLGLRTRQENP